MPGELGTPGRPLEVHAEQFELEVRTSDPASPVNLEMWLRSDLDSGDKVATIRWNEQGAIRDIPVFATGTSGSDVEEVFRVQTPNGIGYVPTTSTSPAFSELKLQHGGSTLGWHDAVTADTLPDSGVSRWEFEQDVTDSWGSNDWSDNTSAGFTTDAQVGEYAKLFDGDDYLENGDIITETDAFTLSAWVYPDSLGSAIYSTDDKNTDPRGFQLQILSDGEIRVFDGNNANDTGQTIGTGSWSFVAMAKDGSGNLTIDVNGTRSYFSASFNSTVHPLWMGIRSPVKATGYFDGRIDDGRNHDKQLSDTELDNLRTTGSI